MKKTHIPAAVALALAALTLAKAAEPRPAPPPAEPIRALTFNLRMSLAAKDAKNKNDWASRRESIVDVITRFPDGNGPYDFVGTQETVIHPDPELNQRDHLAARLAGYGSIGRSREADESKGEAMILFWKKDRWRPDPGDTGTFWLSDTPEVPGSKAGGAACPRTAVFGLFHEIDATGAPATGGRKVYVYVTHLDHIGELARQRGAKALLAHAAARKDKTAPVIIMGDFNCAADSPAVRYLLGEETRLDGAVAKPPMALADAFAEANRGAGKNAGAQGTYNDFKEPGAAGPKIDFILASRPLRALSSKIILTRRADGGFVSDHYPVEAVLAWEN